MVDYYAGTENMCDDEYIGHLQDALDNALKIVELSMDLVALMTTRKEKAGAYIREKANFYNDYNYEDFKGYVTKGELAHVWALLEGRD